MKKKRFRKNERDKNELICYRFDGLGKKGKFKKVLFPKNPQRVRDIILKSENIVPRGNGNNVVGACIPNNSIVVDMKKFTKIKFDTKNEIVTAESGITIKELNEKLKSVGYEFLINSEEESTIGGMIAMNSSGYYGKYGKMKDWIESIEYINGRGEKLRAGRSDLSEVCGMEGSTGIILNTRLSVVKYREKSISVFQTDEIEEVFSMAKRLKLDHEVIMLRLYSPLMSRVIGFPEKYNLVIGFNSGRGRIKNEDYGKLWDRINNERLYLGMRGFVDSEDPKFMFEKVKDFCEYLDRLKLPYISDLHLGIVFPFFGKNDLKKEDVLKMIRRMDGRPGKYGYGIKRKNLVDSIQKKIINRIKLRHDPFVKMNPGKLIDVSKNGTNFGINSGINPEVQIKKNSIGKKNNFVKKEGVEKREVVRKNILQNKGKITARIVNKIPRKRESGEVVIRDNFEFKKKELGSLEKKQKDIEKKQGDLGKNTDTQHKRRNNNWKKKAFSRDNQNRGRNWRNNRGNRMNRGVRQENLQRNQNNSWSKQNNIVKKRNLDVKNENLNLSVKNENPNSNVKNNPREKVELIDIMSKFGMGIGTKEEKNRGDRNKNGKNESKDNQKDIQENNKNGGNNKNGS